MVKKPQSTMALLLAPRDEDREALNATLAAYRQAMAILDGTTCLLYTSDAADE